MLRLRILSALVMAPLALAAVFAGQPVFTLLVLVAAVVMSWEWARLIDNGRFGVCGWLIMAVALLTVAAVALGRPVIAPLVALGGGVVLLGFAQWQKHPRPAWVGLGALYIGLPAGAILWLRDYADNGLWTVLWLLAVVWATDIGAYIAGRLIGGPKLAPTISPNKTWAGLAGGMLLAGAVGAVIAGVVDVSDASVPAVAGALLAIVAQLGDLFESAIKRIVGVKDSSNLIPGHGGLLDRVDGLLTVAPTVVLFYWMGGGAIL